MEGKVSDTLLEAEKTIVIGGGTYLMSPPSIATLILASKYIGKLPDTEMKSEHMISEVIKNADQLKPLGKALASMILGAKKFNEKEKLTFKNFYKKRKTNGELLAEKIILEDINKVLTQFFIILKLMNLNDFFQITTFLITLNLTKPTKKVES